MATAPKKKATEQGEAADKAKAERAPRVSKSEVERIYDEQGGRCWVTGAPLHPMRHGSEWHVSDGHAITDDARRLKGSRSWDELRQHILDEMAAAADAVTAKKAALDAARERHAETVKRFGSLLREKDGGVALVVFAGEAASKAETPAPAGRGNGAEAATEVGRA